MSDAHAYQGTLDGFCGLYSAAHILTINDGGDYESRSRTIFFRLLQSCEKLGFLTAARIAGPKCGFGDVAIARIINGAPATVLSGHTAVAFSSARFEKSRFNRKPNDILALGGKLIVQEDGEGHWIAVMGHGESSKYHCYDPIGSDGTTKRDRIAWNQGVLIAPQNLIGEF